LDFLEKGGNAMKKTGLMSLGVLSVFLGIIFILTGALQAAEKDGVTIGYAVSLTGPFSLSGNDVHRGYQVWVDKIKKGGGLLVGDKRLPLKVIYYDDESNAPTCVKQYERLITSDKVDLILSPWGSQFNFAASAVAEKYHYPIILSTASATNIFERGFKYIFETTQLSDTMVEPWINFLKAYSKEIKTVAIIYENFLFTVALNQSLSKFVQEAGAKLLLSEKYPMGGKDFTGILLKVKGLNPDAVFVLNIMPSSIYATRQAHEVGLKPKLFMVNIGPMYREEFIAALGNISEKVYESGFWHRDLPFPTIKEYVTGYELKYGREPSTDSAYAYLSGQILEQAIKKAGTIDREKLNETLHKEKFETILGLYEYDERGINKAQRGFICQVQNKKRVIVWPKDLANATPQFLR
jgi:branched-chain amino acid transport system substrate-binding protein